MRKYVATAALLILNVLAAPAVARKWTDSTGKHTVEAEFVAFKDGDISLKYQDGTIHKVSIERLSKADQEFVKSLPGAGGGKRLEKEPEGGDQPKQSRKPHRFPSPARERRPVVVVSVASYEKLIQVLRASVGSTAPTMVAGWWQTLGIRVHSDSGVPIGLDPKRPAGVVLETDGREAFYCLGFIPTTDLNRLLDGGLMTRLALKPAGNGVYEFKGFGIEETWYLTERNGWVFFTPNRDQLKKAPADPVPMLAGLNTSYDLAWSACPRNLGPEFRMGLSSFLRDMVKHTYPFPGLDSGLLLASVLVEQGDTLTLGLSANPQSKSILVDMSLIAEEGTNLARYWSSVGKARTKLRGFLVPGATLSGNRTGVIRLGIPFEIVGILEMISDSKQWSWGAWEKRVLDGLSNGVRKSCGPALFDDVGITGVMRPTGVTLAAGAQVTDSTNLDKAMKRLAAGAAARTRHRPDAAKVINLDVATYHGVRFHTLSLPIPEKAKNREKMVQVFGETLEVAVGVEEKIIYLAVGKNPLPALKHVIKESQNKDAASLPAAQSSLAVGQMLKFLAEWGEERDRLVAAKLASVLEQTPGKDHVKLTGTAIPGGLAWQLELEEGVVRAIAVAAAEANK